MEEAKLHISINLKQVDEVVPYLKSNNPDIRQKAEKFLEKYNEFNEFPYGNL